MDLTKLVSKNQTIKIIPSMEDSLRSMGLNVDLDDKIESWFNQLKVSWKTWKKSATIENHIEALFYSVPDPHRLALIFAIKNEESKDCKPKTLPYFTIEILQKWSHVNGVLPDDSLKLPAFHIATQQRNQHFLSLLLKTYQVATIREIILPIVKDMIKNENCRQACHIVIALELFDDIPVEKLLFPLVLQDKVNMLDEYLSECPSQVKNLLLFLDRLLDRNSSINDYVQKYIDENNVSQIKYERLHYKSLGKLIARLCNKYNIPIETCKNLSKNRTTRGLKYLIYQKYQEHNVSSYVWDDLVKDSLKVNAESAKEFIDVLIDYDKKEALKWAEYLKMDENELPLALRDLSLQESPSEGGIDTTEQPEENWDTPESSQMYYKLSLPNENILSIDTSEKLAELMTSDLKNHNIIGIDCEWKPSFGATQSQVALIQLATMNNVYLVDTLVLNKQELSPLWYTFNKSLLDNAEIIKVGFGLEQDFKEMKASVIGLSNIKAKGEGLLDLALLWKSLLEYGLNLPSNHDNGGSSLNSLVQTCFGLPLEKSEQCSNWELRPLRDTQIKYAAVDAYVLIDIYYFLEKSSIEQGINFEEICNDIMLEGKKKCPKKNKNNDKTHSIEPNKLRFSETVKIFIEPKLSNLMSYLRYCGLDTVPISATMLWYDVINVAIGEGRYLVLSKLKYTPTANYPQNHILDIGKGSIKEQLQRIFTYYDIMIPQSNLLSRCCNCNSDELKKLDLGEIVNLCNEYQTSTARTENLRDSDDDDDYSGFLNDSDGEEYVWHTVKSTPKISCKTSKGIEINISNVSKLLASPKPGILCESCGKLFWEDDEMLKSISEVIFAITKLRVMIN